MAEASAILGRNAGIVCGASTTYLDLTSAFFFDEEAKDPMVYVCHLHKPAIDSLANRATSDNIKQCPMTMTLTSNINSATLIHVTHSQLVMFLTRKWSKEWLSCRQSYLSRYTYGEAVS